MHNLRDLKPIQNENLVSPTSTAGIVHQVTYPPFKTFKNRMTHKTGPEKAKLEQTNILESDPVIQTYYSSVKQRRGNEGYLSENTRSRTRYSIAQFVKYTDLEVTNHTYTDLINIKRANQNDTRIETALREFAGEQPIKTHTSAASYILGIFKSNFAPLQLRLYNHFEPTEENCTEGIFQEIYEHLTPEQQDMIQWGQYAPERAKATYRVPYEDIDLSRTDYAIITIQSLRSKARVKHPCFIPIGFAKRIIEQAKASRRNCPFPNHESEWKLITEFAKREYHVRLISNYLRKRFEGIAEDSGITPSLAAFLMGDKGMINATGHLPLFYNPNLRTSLNLENMIQEFDKTLAVKLDINTTIDADAKSQCS